MPNFAIATIFSAKDRVTRTFTAMGRAADKFGDKSSRAFKKAGRSGRGYTMVLGKMKTMLLGLVGAMAVKRAGGFLIGEAAKLESAVITFKTLTGSIDESRKMVDKLNQTAAKTPFEFEHLAGATRMLLGFQAVTKKDLIPTMRMLGDAAMGNADAFQGIFLAYAQIQAGGKATMQDINQLINRGVPILGEVAKVLGTDIKLVRKMVEKGQVTDKVVTKAFQNMTSKGGIFYKGMEDASQSYFGLMSTLRDSTKQTAAAIGTAVLPQLKDQIKALIKTADRTKEWAKANQDLIKTRVDKYLIPTLKVLKFIKPAILPVTGAILAIGAAFAIAAGSPLAIFTAAVVGLSALAVGVMKAWKPVKTFFKGLVELIDKISIRGISKGVQRVMNFSLADFFNRGEKGQEQRQITPPNKTEIEARRQINFNGRLDIAGAPPGSTVESSTTGAPPLQMELMGVNP